MVTAAQLSASELTTRIANVRPLPYAGTGPERFAFTLDGVPHLGSLRGRNRDLCLRFGEEQDRGIALRVLLDGDAEACRHNAMTERKGDPVHAWQCADCGHVYGEKGGATP